MSTARVQLEVVIILRAIHIFPDFHNADAIHQLRKQYDPLAQLVAPHITLVFPFESSLSTGELHHYVESALHGFPRFPIELRGVTGAEAAPGSDDNFLFLNVKVGNDAIIRLHDRFYAGILKSYFNRRVTYVPHLTVGRIKTKDAFLRALEATEGFSEIFCTCVDDIAVETIGDGGESVIELVVPLA